MIINVYYQGGPISIGLFIDLLNNNEVVEPVFFLFNLTHNYLPEELIAQYNNSSIEQMLDYKNNFGELFQEFETFHRLCKANIVIQRLQEIYSKNLLLDLKILDFRNIETKNKHIFAELVETPEYKQIEKETDWHFVKDASFKENRELNRYFHYLDNISNDVTKFISVGASEICAASFKENKNLHIRKLDILRIYEKNLNLGIEFFDYFNKIEFVTETSTLRNAVLKFKDNIEVLKIISDAFFCVHDPVCGVCKGCKIKNESKIEKILNFKKIGLPIDKLLK
jgi:hypothetical protein